MKMKRIIIIVSLLLTLAGLPAGGKVPAEISNAVNRARRTPTLCATFDVNGTGVEVVLSADGRFTMEMEQARVYYDGKTQWAYSVADNEVTILEPTPDELLDSNPLAVLTRLESDFDGKALAGKSGVYRLTPKKPGSGDIAEATVTFTNGTDPWPKAITLVRSNGRAEITGIKITESKQRRPDSAFRPRLPKGVTVTDLR